jgi:biopolymer transport protein TolQ
MQFTLYDLWGHMGLFARLVVAALAIMSISSLLVAAERFLAFRKSKRASLTFARTVGPLLAKRDLNAASAVQPGPDVGHLGRVIMAGLGTFRSSGQDDPDLIFESVARSLERQGQREMQNLRRGQGLLATVSSTAPFVGLLGTVVGIVNSFQAMAASGSGGLGTVSAGIAEALVTTAFGLLVAIPAVMIYNYFQGFVDAINVDIAESSNELLDIVARQLKSNAGRPAAMRHG